MYLEHRENCICLNPWAFANNNVKLQYVCHSFDSQNFILQCSVPTYTRWSGLFLCHMVKHYSLMSCAKFNGNFWITLKVIVKDTFGLLYCGHGVDSKKQPLTWTQWAWVQFPLVPIGVTGHRPAKVLLIPWTRQSITLKFGWMFL